MTDKKLLYEEDVNKIIQLFKKWKEINSRIINDNKTRWNLEVVIKQDLSSFLKSFAEGIEEDYREECNKDCDPPEDYRSEVYD